MNTLTRIHWVSRSISATCHDCDIPSEIMPWRLAEYMIRVGFVKDYIWNNIFTKDRQRLLSCWICHDVLYSIYNYSKYCRNLVQWRWTNNRKQPQVSDFHILAMIRNPCFVDACSDFCTGLMTTIDSFSWYLTRTFPQAQGSPSVLGATMPVWVGLPGRRARNLWNTGGRIFSFC